MAILLKNLKYSTKFTQSKIFVRRIAAFKHTNNTPIKFYNNIVPRQDALLKMAQSATMTRLQSTEPEKNTETSADNLSVRQKLQKAVAEYGSTVIVFHVGISLISLGGCYLAVSSGLDVNQLLLPIGLSEETVGKLAANAGTFAIAYGVHKIFAPVRIAITLTATPFIVRYLRQIGFLKK